MSNKYVFMRPRLFISVVGSLLLFIAPSLQAADIQWPAKIGSWTRSPTLETVKPLVLIEPLSAELLKESGFVTSSDHTYEQGNRRAPMKLYVFHDSSGAYEAFTSLQSGVAFLNTAYTLLPKGNVVLWISRTSNISPEDQKAFETWESSISDGVASPPVASYLPENGKDPISERYALGPVGFQDAAKALGRPDAAGLVEQLGFNSGAEAVLARYKNGKGAATLLLIDYPTPQLAEVHLKHMERALAAAKNGDSVERKGSLLSIVLAPSSAEYAAKLRSEVRYETQVTWNEASTTATDPPITSTLVKIIIATGVFMMVTIVVGIAFGGVRIITKRLFPGKVFDRKDQIEVLQLGLSSKPIDPSDMY